MNPTNNQQYYASSASSPDDMSFKDIAVILWRRKLTLIVVISLSLAAAYLWAKKTPIRYRATGQMIVVSSTPLSSSKGIDIAELLGNTSSESAPTQVAMLESDEMGRRTLLYMQKDAKKKKTTLEKLGFKHPNLIPASYAKDVDVEIVKDTNLINVKAEAPANDSAALLANSVCMAFKEWRQEIAQEDSKALLDSLGVRATRAKDKLRAAEHAQEVFQKDHNIPDAHILVQVTVQDAAKRRADAATAHVVLIAQLAKLAELGKQLKTTNEAIRNGKGVRDDALVAGIQQDLNKLQIERGAMALQVTDQFPGMLPALDAKIKDETERLKQAVQDTLDNKMPSLAGQGLITEQLNEQVAAVAVAKASADAADALSATLEKKMGTLPLDAMRYTQLANEVQLDLTQYGEIQSSLNMVTFSKDMLSGSVDIAAKALAPDHPFQPDLPKNLTVGAVAGVGLAVLLAFAFEHADHRVRTSKQVRQLVKAPILGSLPQLSRRDMRRIARRDPAPIAVEAYNMTWANFTMVDAFKEHVGPLTLLVTSAYPNEGKSSTAAQLAQSVARANKRVVLVDADLRRPTLARHFGCTIKSGLAEALTGAADPLESLVNIGDNSNIRLLASGRAMRNPSDLLSSPAMRSTVERLRQDSDIVIIDSPPCAVVADALLLAPIVDAVVFVVGVGHVDEDALTSAIDMLKDAAHQHVYLFMNRGAAERKHTYKEYYSHAPRYDQVDTRTPRLSRHEALPLSNGAKDEMTNGARDKGKSHSDAEEITK